MVNVKDTMLGTTTRKNFAKINEVMQMPNLIEVQKASYQWFLDEGLKEVFKDMHDQYQDEMLNLPNVEIFYMPKE